jgi:hypothetical protein
MSLSISVKSLGKNMDNLYAVENNTNSIFKYIQTFSKPQTNCVYPTLTKVNFFAKSVKFDLITTKLQQVKFAELLTKIRYQINLSFTVMLFISGRHKEI